MSPLVKVWSESHVSEDFHLSLRLQIAGFSLRLASYHGEGFKEGVSLTVFDELARWEKYAYGTNELVFNPLNRWYRGPITKLYLSYFFSGIKSSSKLMVLSYTFTYYAIAAALPLTLLNYLLVGWWPNTLDEFYVTSWKVLPVVLIVFDVIVGFSSTLMPCLTFIVSIRLLYPPMATQSEEIIGLSCASHLVDSYSGTIFWWHILSPIQGSSVPFRRH